MKRSVLKSWTIVSSVSLSFAMAAFAGNVRADGPVIVVVTHESVAQNESDPADFNLGIEEEPPTIQRKSGSNGSDTDEQQRIASVCPEDNIVIGKPITEISASIASTERQRPEDCSTNLFQERQMAAARSIEVVQFNWQPTNFFHQPLYFDDTPLERYGQSVCPVLQPVISSARFFVTLPIIPYKMGIDRTHDCVSTLGYYRPGACNPCVRERFPALECDAALLEAGVALALVFALP